MSRHPLTEGRPAPPLPRAAPMAAHPAATAIAAPPGSPLPADTSGAAGAALDAPKGAPAGLRQDTDALAASLFAEVLISDQLARSLVQGALPRGMQISHFSVLNLLAHLGEERTPADLARALHVTRGAMTNTLGRLEHAGHIHIRPDWDDARRKLVAISPAGRRARDDALRRFMPLIAGVVRDVGAANVRAALPVLRALRIRLEAGD